MEAELEAESVSSSGHALPDGAPSGPLVVAEPANSAKIITFFMTVMWEGEREREKNVW